MELETFNTSIEEFNQMREVAKVFPEIKEIFKENDYTFEKIQEKLEKMNDDHLAKAIFFKVLPTLMGMNVGREFYEYLADKYQTDGNIAIEKGLKFKTAWEETAKRNNDYKNIDVKEAFTVFDIETKDKNKKLTPYRKKAVFEFVQNNLDLEALDEPEIILFNKEIKELKRKTNSKLHINDIKKVKIERHPTKENNIKIVQS